MNLSNEIDRRIGDVLMTATEFREFGVIDWAARAIADARQLGRLRNKDLEALERLERRFSSGFYSDRGNARFVANRARLQAIASH